MAKSHNPNCAYYPNRNYIGTLMESSIRSNSYYRVIALWALCEAMIGGIIHGMRIPVSGLIVGSAAVICISLIGWYHPGKGNILKATLVVAIFKMILSPQAPVTAYIAVFFQGAMGELLFWKRRYYIISCFLLASLALLESALQRIIVLTILYGNDLWKAINDLMNKLTDQQHWTNYSRLFIGSYIAIHLLMGLLIGGVCSVLPKKILLWKNKLPLTISVSPKLSEYNKEKKKKRGRIVFIIWIAFLFLYIQSYFNIGPPLLPESIPLKILMRSVIIVVGWVFIIGPLLRKLLHAWLQKKQGSAQLEVAKVMALLPGTEQVIRSSWDQAKTRRGFKRYSDSFKSILAHSLYDESTGVYILTAPVGTGKTTSVLQWIGEQEQVYGILSPVINGKRYFYDIETKTEFPMEADEATQNTLSVGRFVFRKEAFEKACAIIERSADKAGWLVIDEIGPLELRGEGLATSTVKVLAKRNNRILLVVREGLAEKVMAFCKTPCIIIHDLSELPKE